MPPPSTSCATRASLSRPCRRRPGLTKVELSDPNVVVLIDEDRCATRLAYEHRELYASREVEAGTTEELETLVAAVDALDLWKKERPTFRGGLALDEIFWDNVATLIPVGHPWHDRFISALLRAVSALLREGASPARVEAEIAATRRRLRGCAPRRRASGRPDPHHPHADGPSARPVGCPVPATLGWDDAVLRPRFGHVPARVRPRDGERQGDPRRQCPAHGLAVVPLEHTKRRWTVRASSVAVATRMRPAAS